MAGAWMAHSSVLAIPVGAIPSGRSPSGWPASAARCGRSPARRRMRGNGWSRLWWRSGRSGSASISRCARPGSPRTRATPPSPANGVSIRRADPVDRHRRRGARRRPAPEFPHRSRSSGPGMRRRPVALVAPSELFLRMVRLARLSRDRDFDRGSALLSVGLGELAGAGLHVLDPGARHRHPAAGAADAALARRALSRLSGAHQRVLSAAAAALKGSGST